MSLITISLGSNIEPQLNLEKATNEIAKFATLEKTSKIYKSKSVGFEGNDFLNQVILCDVKFELEETYFKLKKIEKEMGRVKNVNKFSDRLIDLDLLTFNDEISEGKITLPHNDILKYSFVLVPFAEIYPEFIHPVNQKSIETLLKEKNSFLSEVEKIN
jgi:2-amino-4-hydroxy-6-hydroxymethyldihydropteridine diphosphokinase